MNATGQTRRLPIQLARDYIRSFPKATLCKTLEASKPYRNLGTDFLMHRCLLSKTV